MIDETRLAALAWTEGREATPKNLLRAARETSPEAASWAFAQWESRRRARAKFARAADMLFAREALEQATHERVAAYHASRFPPGSAVVDMTCGIGADLIALAARGPAVGFELDPERAAYARWNLKAHGVEAEVREADSLAWLKEGGQAGYLLADPARRVEGRRTLDPSQFAPDPTEIARLAAGSRLALVKLSPLLPDRFLAELGPRVEFLSFGDECREALVFLGAEAVPGRMAVHVESGAFLPASEDLPLPAEEPDAYLFDADPAAIRVHGLGALCREYGLRPLGDAPGYLTGPDSVRSPWLRTYRTLGMGKPDAKSIRADARSLGRRVEEVKQRGAGVDGDHLRRELSALEGRPVSVVLWSVGKSVRRALVEAES